MDKLSYFDQKARAAEGRREALRWLSRRLQWERRLTELRPGAMSAKKAAYQKSPRVTSDPAPLGRSAECERPRSAPLGRGRFASGCH